MIFGLKGIECLIKNGYIRRASPIEISSFVVELEQKRKEVVPELVKTYMADNDAAPEKNLQYLKASDRYRNVRIPEEHRSLFLSIRGGTYIALRKFRIPDDLALENGVTFLIPSGIKSPEGYFCHSTVLDLNRSPACQGVECDDFRRLRQNSEQLWAFPCNAEKSQYAR